MLKAKTAAATPQAYSKETDEMKMRNNLKRLGQLNAEISEQAIALEQEACSNAFIEARAAWRKFQAHCDITDSVRTGKEPTEDETAAYNVAEKVYDDALRAFFGYPFQTIEGHQIKAQMILENDFLRGEFDNYLDDHLRGLAGASYHNPHRTIKDVIRAHKEAHEAIECDDVTEDEEVNRLSEMEARALKELLDYKCTSMSDVIDKAAYILSGGGDLVGENVTLFGTPWADLFLRSIVDAASGAKAAGGEPEDAHEANHG